MKKIIIIILIMTSIYYGEKIKIKFATLAPRGTTWMNVMTDFNNAVKDATNGEVSFQLYPGGVMGDEIDAMRKMKIGLLHSGGFTGVALGEILPEVRIFDSPFLFKNYEEVDSIHELLYDEFSKKFEEKGYILLGWTEVGFVYIYTNKGITKLSDLSGTKMWMWEGDPIAKATFKAMDFSPIPLGMTDVLMALQTNMIDGFYVSPYGAVSLQWHTKVNHMLDMPMANAVGAVIVSKKKFDEIPEAYQDTVLKLGQKYMKQLTKLGREDNGKVLEELKASGMTFTQIENQEEMNKILAGGEKAREELVKKGIFSKELLEKVETKLQELRNEKTDQSN